MTEVPKASGIGVKSLLAHFEKNKSKPKTPENFSKEQREIAEKEAAALILARKKAAAYNMAVRQLELKQTVEVKTPAEQANRDQLRKEARRLSTVLRTLDVSETERPAAAAQERRATHILLATMAEELEAEMKKEELNAIKEEQEAEERVKQAAEDARRHKEEQEELRRQQEAIKKLDAEKQQEALKQLQAQKELELQKQKEAERKAAELAAEQERRIEAENKDRIILTSYLKENYPEKLDDVEKLLKQYAGNLDILFEELGKDQKFKEVESVPEEQSRGDGPGYSTAKSVMSDGEETVHSYADGETVAPSKRNDKAFLKSGVDLRQVITGFYTIYAESKLADIDEILKHFENRESDLFRTLEVKYDVTFSTDGTCVPNNGDKLGEPFMEASSTPPSKFAVDVSSKLKGRPNMESAVNSALASGGSAMM